MATLNSIKSIGLLFPFLMSCSSDSEIKTEKPLLSSNKTDSLGPDTVISCIAPPLEILKIENDTLYLTSTDPNDMVKNWQIADFIVSFEAENYSEDLIQFIEYEKKQWSNIGNPFIATYNGNEFGDYFHIIFEDDTNHIYDFGFGNNDFGNIQLFKGEFYDDNPKYLSKIFKIYWEWKLSSFPCCSGEYVQTEAYLPSIVKLELVK